MENNRNFASRFDWILAFILLGFLAVSLMAISSAQTTNQYGNNFVFLQFRWYIIGAIIVGAILYLEPDQYKKMAWYLYGAGLLALIVLIFLPEGQGQIAERINGAKSWFKTPLGNIQPSEFMKTFFILAMARMISKHHDIHTVKSLQ